MGPSLPDELVAETRELMLRRTRVAIHLGWSIHLAFVGIDAWRLAPERHPEAIVIRLAGIALLFVLLAATHARQARGWSAWIAVAALAVMMLVTTAIMPLFQGARDPQYAIQGTGLVLCVLGAGIILPLAASRMLLLGAIAVILHIVCTVQFPLGENLPVLLATVASVVIATAGAHELGRSRRADFEGRRAKEELWRARSDFVAMLTHDIRNPLAAIDGYVEMLQSERDLTPPERDEILAHVQRAVRHAIALAVDFLDASRVEADRFALKAMEPIDLGELLGQVVADHHPHAVQKGIAIVYGHDGHVPAVRADRAALDRVFTNLVGNAIKHTPAGGSIRVGAEPSVPGWVAVVVEDTGEGITPGQETRLFERYTQAASRADSTGLGLFIARTITTAHGGTISAENRRDRSGARFRVVLPTLGD